MNMRDVQEKHINKKGGDGMLEWSELMKGKAFITDLGNNQTSVIDEKETVVGRYAVWSPVTNSTGHQVVEVSDNLETLMSKYKITDDRICYLVRERSGLDAAWNW